jgi:hypothetical protein
LRQRHPLIATIIEASRMRLALGALLLVCACSTKTPRPDAQGLADANSDASDVAAEHPIQCPAATASGFPCCYFANSAEAQQTSCDPAECMILLDAGAPTPDAGDPSCRPCPSGYACAIVCPSPLGGCGGPPTCCRVRQ